MAQRKLSAADRDAVISLWVAGWTLRRIAAAFGITYQRVQQIVQYIPKERTTGAVCKRNASKVIYPHIRRFMVENNLTFCKMSERMGGSITARGLDMFLSGERGGTKDTIDKLLAFTGMTYEEAFFQEGGSA